MVQKDAQTQDAWTHVIFSPMSPQVHPVACDEIFGGKTLTPIKSEPEVVTTGRFERHTGAPQVHVSVRWDRSDSKGSGDTGPPKSKMATVAPPEVLFRSTSGRRNMEEMVEDQVPQEFPGRGPS
jgi:hypothetical protein